MKNRTRTIYVKDERLWAEAKTLADSMGVSMSHLIERGLVLALQSAADIVRRLDAAQAKKGN